jgi:glycosyltransferase involved in cell wall biosynthesis
MRIAWLIYGNLELVSGGFLYDRKVVEGLRAQGVEVEVISLPWPSYLGQLALNAKPIRFPRAPESYHAIVQDQLVHPSLLVPNLWAKRRGAKLVALVHNLTVMQPATPHKWLRGPLEDAYLRSVHGLISVCESTLADIRSRVGARVPSVVAHAGRDHVEPAFLAAAHEARAHAAGPLRVLFLANVLPHKGLHHLLHALARLPGGVPIELEIVGTMQQGSHYAREIEALVERHNLASKLHVHGQLLGTELARKIAECHVLALPSDREAYPLSCLEALGFGLPVLTTCHGGTGELVTHGKDGFLLEPHDHDGWAHALGTLAKNRALLSTMGHHAHARWRAHGTWRDTARIFAEFLRTLS